MPAQMQPLKQHRDQLGNEEGCSPMSAPPPPPQDLFQAATQDRTEDVDEFNLYVTYDRTF